MERAMTPMHVVMLGAAPVKRHGWGRYTYDMIKALAEQHAQITLITATDAPEDPGLPLVGYHRILPSLTPATRLLIPHLLAAVPQVMALARQAKVIHATAEPYALCAVLCGAPLLVTAHGTYLPLTLAGRGAALYRRVYGKAKILCVSAYTESQVLAALPNAHTKVILNGVDADHFSAPTPRPEPHAPTVITVGQVKPRKGAHILVEAMAIVRQHVPDAQALIIGDTTAEADYARNLEALIKRLGLTGAVRLTGRLSDQEMLGWYHRAHAFTIPALNMGGRFEGFGLTFLEASAAGVPVVGTLGNGGASAIRHGETGYLLDPDDHLPEKLAEMLIQLFQDSPLRGRLGAAGVQFARENTWQHVAAQVLAAYETRM
jgi:phosphatidyl-myo-inositol dimannoside synthase